MIDVSCIYIHFPYGKLVCHHISIQLPENALTTNVNVAGNLKGWSAAMANKSSPVKRMHVMSSNNQCSVDICTTA